MSTQSIFKDLYAGVQLEFEKAIKHILRVSAEALKAERASLWLLKNDSVFCEHMYIRSEKSFIGGLILNREECAGYLRALEDKLLFESSSVEQDERLKGCMVDYLKFVGTSSVIGVAVSHEGKIVGFLLYEFVSKERLDTFLPMYSASLLSLIYEIQRKKFFTSMFQILSSIENALQRVQSKEEAFSLVCRIGVDEGVFRMVWIGLVDSQGDLKPVCSAGQVEGYLDWLKLNIYDERLSKGPSGRAIIEGKVQVNNDTETNPELLPFRKEMLKRGYLSSCAYPIRLRNKVIGTINFYHSEKGFFTDEVLKLIERLGENLSFSLEYLEVKKKEKLLYTAIEQGSEWILITDKEGLIEYSNPAVEEMSGYKKEEIIGKKPSLWKSSLHPKEFYEDLWKTILSGEDFHAVFINRRKDGSLFYVDQTIVPIKDEHGNITNFLSVGRDITEMRDLQNKLFKLMNYDLLTNIPNRIYFTKKLEDALNSGKSVVVISLDIHDFNSINSLYGQAVGDKVLISFAKGLSEIPGFCGRYGDDEFLVFKELEDPANLYNLISYIDKVTHVRTDGLSIKLDLMMGVSIYPNDATDAEELIQKAIYALREAKKGPRGSVAFYNRAKEEEFLKKARMLAHLSDALKNREFLVYFQPYYRSSDFSLVGVEELLRWNSPVFGMVEPYVFIPLLESKGLIFDVEDWVVESCLKFFKEHNLNIKLSINFSPSHLNKENFAERILSYIQEYNINPRLINIEITEETLMENVEQVKRLMHQLKEHSISITLDDFGIKYSSLSLLSNLPFDYIKIDKSFVKSIEESDKVLQLVIFITELARLIGAETIAEGVETQRQMEILREIGCNYLQGFYLSEPMPMKSFVKIIHGVKNKFF